MYILFFNKYGQNKQKFSKNCISENSKILDALDIFEESALI